MVQSADDGLVGVVDGAAIGGDLARIGGQSLALRAQIQGYVGQLAKVGRTQGVDVVHVQRVRVHVVTSGGGDGGGLVPGLHQRVVIRGQTSQTLRVLVQQRGVGQGVRILQRLTGGTNVANGVVGPLGSYRGVANREEQSLYSVREANIGGRSLLLTQLEGSARSSLNLLNQNIARGATHTLALVVGYDGVLGPYVGAGQGGGNTAYQVRRSRGAAGRGGVGVYNQQLGPVTYLEVDAHLVVGQGSRGQTYTGVTSEEEGQGNVQGVRGQVLSTMGELGNVTDHVVVTDLLGGRYGEGSPEVQEVVVKASGNQIVEGDGALLDKIVTQVVSPATQQLLGSLVELNLTYNSTEPYALQVVTSARDGGRPLRVEAVGLTHGGLKLGRDDSKPGRSLVVADEIGGGIRATVHILLQLIISSNVNKSRGQRLNNRHLL